MAGVTSLGEQSTVQPPARLCALRRPHRRPARSTSSGQAHGPLAPARYAAIDAAIMAAIIAASLDFAGAGGTRWESASAGPTQSARVTIGVMRGREVCLIAALARSRPPLNHAGYHARKPMKRAAAPVTAAPDVALHIYFVGSLISLSHAPVATGGRATASISW